jgi:hypothetical protein
MDIFSAHPFLAGEFAARPEPLGRYLPIIPGGVVKAYLAEANIQPGDTILDPFGASIGLVMEMARAGYRVLTAVNNPINRFLMEMAADPPTRVELQSALAELASSRKGDERLENHLQSLYLTTCPHCQLPIPALAFTWERGGQFPLTRILDCKSCGNSGEYETTTEDHERVTQLTTTAALHKARALERVATVRDPDRPHVQEALEYYLPRAIYCLITIINKLDGLTISPRQRQILSALVLTACDETNTLWPHPPERPRPRQLVVPPCFRENNVWLALEKSVELWACDDPRIPVSIWPELPFENGSICIYEGRQEELAKQLGKTEVKLVVSTIPRPNQAFWSLSALWAGWLWGREAAAPFKHVLHRHRYDFSWHATALNTVFKNLFPYLPLNAPLFGLLSEPEPPLLTATLLAAGASGFDLRAIALRSSHDPLQIHWQRRAFPRQEPGQMDEAALVEAVRGYLEKRGEPVTYLHLHAACLASLAENRCLNWQRDFMMTINATIQNALKSNVFRRYGGSEHSLETGLWGLSQAPDGRLPLPDQVEMALVKYLTRNPGASLPQIESAIYQEFQGLYTPQLAIIKNVLASYATPLEEGWQLREEDNPSARRQDLRSIRAVLEGLGKRLDYQSGTAETAHHPLVWREDGQDVYSFYLIASAVAGAILQQAAHSGGTGCLVMPGGRAGLVSYKLERDPALRLLAEGWQLLKYRQIRLLADDLKLTRQDWQKELSADPVTDPEQMRLF